MGEGANQAEQQTRTETTPETVDALLEAARYDDIEDIARLASSGVSLDSKDSLGRTALHMAAANGHLDIVEYLVSQGVDLNAANKEKNTALHWACLNGHIEVIIIVTSKSSFVMQHLRVFSTNIGFCRWLRN
ncbi:hypothetical protein H0E87_001427 [Populus deltoides]|uniref:Ankyrin repeat family protein n=1 Tax=Populus deltoides TaxID=3696 RepID=A0A8T2ZRI1_POPDE|nr:hypothetical protein H0E87_001427 [Populus deltoides]